MASETKNKDSALDDLSSDSGSTESSPLVSDVELPLSGTEPSLEHRFFRQRREIAWRWTWLKLQCADLRRQDKKCEETLVRLRQQKGALTLLQPEIEGETHALRTTGLTPPKQNRKIIKRPPDVGQIRNPFQEAAAHTIFSLKPPVMKKMPEKKNPLASSSQSVPAPAASQSPVVDVMDQSSEAQASLSASTEQPAAAPAAAAVEEEEGEDFYGEFYPSDESDEGIRVRSHKRSSRGAEDDGTTPRRKMSRSVDFDLPDTRSLTSSSRSRRNLRASDWDMNNIVVPLSITSPRALTIVKPKEIVTPGWKQQKEKDTQKGEHKEGSGEVRLIDEDAPAPARADGAAASSSENTADELYAVRHTPHEKAERARWETPQKKSDAHAGTTPNDFIVTGEFDRMQSGATGGKAAPRRLDFGTPRSHKKSGGGGGTLRRSRPSRAGLYWMRSRFYADLKWELARREGQPETVFVFRHVNGPIPHPPERGSTGGVGVLKRTNSETIIEDDEVEVTIRHRNPSSSSSLPVVPTAPEPVDPALAEAPYSPSVADTLGGDNLLHSVNLSLSLASSVPDSLMGEAELDDLEMREAQLEQSGEVEGAEEHGLSESRHFNEEGDEEGDEGEDDVEAEEDGASPRERAWAVRSMLIASEESDITIKIRGASSTHPNANAAAAATVAVASTSPTEPLVKEARTAEPAGQATD